MTFDDIEISGISDGQFKLDGGQSFGIVPKILWRRLAQPDRNNRLVIGLNCFLIQCGNTNILVDTGIGTKLSTFLTKRYSAKAGELRYSLKKHDLDFEDIDYVILTHLHFDHAGGCTYHGPTGELIPRFSKATYIVQQSEWQSATHPNELTKASYLSPDFLPLEKSGQLELIDGDSEIHPGVWAIRTGGHTSGHQIIVIKSNDRTIAHLGDILPTHHHVSLPYITAIDTHPITTLNQKRNLLNKAYNENWILLFGHGVDIKAGTLTQQNDKVAFDKSVPI